MQPKFHLYARVSDKSQNLDSQTRKLKETYPEGILYAEKLSGVSKSRPERERMLEALEPNDIVVCIRMSRLSRSITDLFNVVDGLLQGLQALHAHKPRPIVHRDVKPSNTLIFEDLRDDGVVSGQITAQIEIGRAHV